MALSTPCQTPGAMFYTWIGPASVEIKVSLPITLRLTPEQAVILEANLHNVVEIVLAPYLDNTVST